MKLYAKYFLPMIIMSALSGYLVMDLIAQVDRHVSTLALVKAHPAPPRKNPKPQERPDMVDMTGRTGPSQLGELTSAQQADIRRNVFLAVTERASGTAFLVDAGPFGRIVLTAGHVCESAIDGRVMLKTNDAPTSLYAGHVRAISKHVDLCIIRPEASLVHSRIGFQIDVPPAPPASDLVIAGHPGTEPGHKLFAVIRKIKEVNGEEALLDGPIYPGHSGSPVVQRDTGKVVGLVFAVTFQPEDRIPQYGVIVNSPSIQHFIETEDQGF